MSMTVATLPYRRRWLRSFSQVSDPRCHLVCLPHAGGTAGVYREWADHLPSGVAVSGVQYPGRQDRIGEQGAQDMAELSGPIADALEPLVGEPLVQFGHSMGACAAYEVCLELERRHGAVVDLLVVSGSRAPHRSDDDSLHLLPDDQLIAEIRRVNHAFDALLEAPDLVELLLPTIRTDYRLIETYHRPEPIALRAPIEVLGGDEDPDVDPDDLARWASCTTAHCHVSTFPGGHFYLDEDRGPVLEALAGHLRRVTGTG
jgi:pyochelin biosynthetic protein PchC